MSTREQRHSQAREILRAVGIAEGHSVLDCCCGSGIYALAAAALVGQSGLVYAIDSSGARLRELSREADSRRLRNIQIIEEDVEPVIPLSKDAVDFALLFDIFRYFRPTEKNTGDLLRELRRVTRPDAVISVYPAHVDSSGLRRLEDQIRNHGFALFGEFSGPIVHDDNLVSGRVLNFRKQGDC